MSRGSVDYWKPDEALKPYVLSYSRYVVRPVPGDPITEPFFAAWATVRITQGVCGWSFRIGNRHYSPVPPIALFGPTSLLGAGTTEGETSFGIGFSPVGWARLVRLDASAYANRVTPADRIGRLDFSEVANRLRGGADVAPLLDAFLTERLAQTAPEPAAVAKLFALLADPGIVTVADLSERSGISGVQLARLTPLHFGFTPKLLMRRRRFMRVLMTVKDIPRGHWTGVIADGGYYDQAHFLRDCKAFLGMPLGRFLAMPKAMAEEAFRRRSAIVGVPVQALQDLG